MLFDWFLNPVMNQYADFSGRTTRQEYWMFVLMQVVVSIAVGIIGGVADMEYLSLIFMIAIFVPSLAISVRRLHDVGKSGWWWLIVLIPFLGIIIYIVLLATKGDAVANAYGSPAGMSTIPVPVPPPPVAATVAPTQSTSVPTNEG